METLKYCKVRKVKDINRAHPEDAGIDFFIPEDLTPDQLKMDVTNDIVYVIEENNYVKNITLTPGQSVLIPSGIHVKIPHGYALIYMNKSGIAAKKHLHVGSCVIDENYQGECHINLTNVGSCNIIISAGDKIVQGILLPVNYADAELIASKELLYSDGISDRGEGGFGSSNK